MPYRLLCLEDCSLSARGLLHSGADGMMAIVGTGADCRAPAVECSRQRRRPKLSCLTRLT